MQEPDTTHDESPRTLDLAVIGAGIYGIQAARTYLQLHPEDHVLVFEAGNKVGGVWSSERVYDAFWTQTPLGMLEFSDMKLEAVPECDSIHGFFRARYVSEYLETYVGTRSYGGASLKSRIRLRSKVRTVMKSKDEWVLLVESSEQDIQQEESYKALKVIDATGLTSKPNVPEIANQRSFQGLIRHHVDFGRHEKPLLAPDGPSKIVVLGGAKSAADVAYASAKAGKDVTWVIRRSGAGPAAFVAPEGRGMYKNSNESFYTRLVSHFLASFFLHDSKSWMERVLHRTWLGRRLLNKIWGNINDKARSLADYNRPDGKVNGFYNLRPDTPIFWQNDSTGICQQADFFDTIAKCVKVYRADVDCFLPNGMRLEDGTVIDADAVIYATGWKTSHPIYQTQDGSADMALELGLTTKQQLSTMTMELSAYETECRKHMLDRFPVLHSPPKVSEQPSKHVAPLRLYKGILPVDDKTIAFLGQMMLGNHFRAAEVQALYAIAVFDGALKLPSRIEMMKSIASLITWCRLRYLAKGVYGNWLYWDLVPYTDNLLDELGLTSHKNKGYWKNLLSPCFAADLQNLIEEFRDKHKDLYGLKDCKSVDC